LVPRARIERLKRGIETLKQTLKSLATLEAKIAPLVNGRSH
jgi:hypothetical protein